MSEIARRCGRTKRDARGNISGETSWLARRIGLLPEAGRERRWSWTHTNVLALIARGRRTLRQSAPSRTVSARLEPNKICQRWARNGFPLHGSLTLEPNIRHTDVRQIVWPCHWHKTEQSSAAPTPTGVNAGKPWLPGLSVCARVDSNHHPVYTGQGPQPCASTNSATGAEGRVYPRDPLAAGDRIVSALASVHSHRYSANTCSLQVEIHPDTEASKHGSDQTPAGDIRLHPQVLG
jgi:hypothetical protein